MIQSILNGIPFPALVISENQTVVALNSSAITILGDHVVGRHFVTALRQPALLEQIEATAKDGNKRIATYVGRVAGRDTTHRVHITPADNQLILYFEDQSEAREIGQMRRDFVANVSHELRTPLTALLGFIETLQGPARDDPAARDRFLDIMAREAGRMTRLVDDLLTLSRVEATARIKLNKLIYISSLLERVLAEIDPVISANGATVRIDDKSAGAKVSGDDEQLRQVLANLIENAAKYGPQGGAIEISITSPSYDPSLRGVGLVVSVRDQGAGIDAHHIPRLTERFYRVDTHRSRSVGGTGLGLAIVKHIVNRHRGRLRIDSALGEGTTVQVILPVSESQRDDDQSPNDRPD